ncbi:PREDICTED: uncharacterized protein LOC101635718 [Condylura cristata]|uniref:uncharacterized protein LOC101635718 n=1 Tax=Condylura cristata TaxID=143302 RepID=UPI000643C4F0|nr:PREDICTED: uncharacterized protein LOC101635718 [Condylura cristata]
MNSQEVTYADLNLGRKSKRQQAKPKSTKISISVPQEDITYADLNLQNISQDLQGNGKKYQGQGSPGPPEKCIAGLLGLTCLILICIIVAVAVLEITDIVFDHRSETSAGEDVEKGDPPTLRLGSSGGPVLKKTSVVVSPPHSRMPTPSSRRAAEMNDHRVTYAEVKLAKGSKRPQVKPQERKSCTTVTEQGITYAELNLHKSRGPQENGKSRQCKVSISLPAGSPAPPEKRIAGVLGLTCLVLICVIVSVIVKTGWFTYSGSCYYFNAEKKTWNESVTDCQRNNSQLLYIDSEEEMTFFKTITMLSWTGVYRNGSHQPWTLVNGSTFRLDMRLLFSLLRPHDCTRALAILGAVSEDSPAAVGAPSLRRPSCKSERPHGELPGTESGPKGAANEGFDKAEAEIFANIKNDKRTYTVDISDSPLTPGTIVADDLGILLVPTVVKIIVLIACQKQQVLVRMWRKGDPLMLRLGSSGAGPHEDQCEGVSCSLKDANS